MRQACSSLVISAVSAHTPEVALFYTGSRHDLGDYNVSMVINNKLS